MSPIPRLGVAVDPTHEAGNDFGEECAGLTVKTEPEEPRGGVFDIAEREAESSSPWIELDRFREELRQITRTRMSTKFPTLDRATEGGMSGDTVALLVGPVGSGKTTLASQLGSDRAKELGGHVYVYAPDQGGSQYLKRIASTFGNVAEDDDAYARFEAAVAPVFRIIDERRDGVTIESFRDLVLAAGDVNGAVASVIIDTPQTVATAENEEERQRIQKATGIARDLTSGLLVPVYVCSHANRASSAARNKQDRTLARSAGLGDASLEHRAQVMLFMERCDRHDGVTEIDVEIPKAPVAGLRCRLALDVAMWRLREIDMAVADAEREEKAETTQHEKDQNKRFGRRAQVKALLFEKKGPRSLVSLKFAWKGNAADLLATLAVLVEERLVVPSFGPSPVHGGKPLKFYEWISE